MDYYHVNFNDAKEILLGYDYDLDNLPVGEFDDKYNSDNALSETEAIALSMMDLRENKIPNSPISITEKISQLSVPTWPTGVKFLKDNMDNPEAFPYLSYLKYRKVTLQEIYEHNMGYITSGTITIPQVNKVIPIFNSVIFTTFDEQGSGKAVYWNTRSINQKAVVKSLNAPNKEGLERGKDNCIFNLNHAKHQDKIVICEGVFNALMCGDCGVATFGKAVTDDQVLLLKQAYQENPSLKLYVFLDTDAATQGIDLAKRLIAFCPSVYMVSNPYPGDANDIGRAKVAELIKNAKPFSTATSLSYLVNAI